jgi:zinc transport system ATP-binding protein
MNKAVKNQVLQNNAATGHGSAAAEALLSARDIGYAIGGRQILTDIGLDVMPNTIVTLIGPNGAGKTTLIRLLLGLLPMQTGRITRKRGLRVGYVPQRMSIDDTMPLRVRDFLHLGGHYAETEMRQMLDEVEAGQVFDSPIQRISGGELQRVLLARALLKHPELLVLDEPAQGVDVIGQQALYKLIGDIRDRHACAVLMISHDLHLVMASTDTVICLNTHVCCTGHPEDVSAHPEYLKIFGGSMEGLAVYAHHHDHEHDIHGDIIDDATGEHHHTSDCGHTH